MNLNSISLSGPKRLMIMVLMLAGTLFVSCRKDETPVPLNTATIRFSAAAYTILLNADTPLTVTLPLSLPLEKDGVAVVTMGNGTVTSDQYNIDPALPSGTLTIPLIKGATEVSFKVSSLNNFEGSRTLILKLSTATGGVAVANVNATTTITLMGTKPIVPEITSSVSGLDDFGSTTKGTATAAQSFTVSSTLLTSDITVLASDYFQVSLDGLTFQSFVQIGSADANQGPVKVFVRFLPTTGINQSVTGTITSSATGVANSVVNVSGTEEGNAEVPGVLVLNENFDYGAAAGELVALGKGNWAAFSGTATPAQYVPAGLSFPGYAASAVGGAALSQNGMGSRQDLDREFTPQNSGTVYVAQLLNFASAPAAGDFFTSLRDPAAAYFNRLYAKDVDGNLSLGLGKSSATTAYSPTNYSYGTTYLVVTKYDFSTGLSSLFVISGAIPAVEPATPAATTDVGSAPATLKDIIIRQNNGTPLTTTIDGIRVATTWKTVLTGL